MSAKKPLGLMFAGILLSLMVMYSVAMFGATDEGVDLTGTDYEEQYDAIIDISLINNSIMEIIGFVFIAMILIGAPIYIIKVVK